MRLTELEEMASGRATSITNITTGALTWSKSRLAKSAVALALGLSVQLALVSIGVVAQADDQTPTKESSKSKTDKSKTDKSKTTPIVLEPPVAATDKNIDDLITNANLRALSGSKSRWSISSSFTYDGGTVSTPFAEGRPDISGGSGISTDTDINALLNVKYNLDKQNSLLLGFGVRKMAPFVSSGPSSAFYAHGGKDFDAYDPSLTYQYIYKLGPIQSVLQVGLVHYTREDIRSPKGNNGNLNNGLSFDQENIYEIGKTHISVGASVGFAGNTPTDSAGDYSQYQFWIDPYLEYQITEMINFRTVANVWTYESYKQKSGVVRDTFTESVGLGFSITRDIFLYPNVQFLPEDTSLKLTNVGLSATINLF